MADLRQHPPVEKNVERPESLRQTTLSQFDKCPRSGYLALRYGGGVGTHAQARGTAFHMMAEEATRQMVAQGERRFPPELARDLMEQVLQENPDLVVPVAEHESLRSMAWNWAKGTELARRPAGIERKIALDLDGWRLHGTLDLLFIEGREVRIKDYKTGFVIPKQEVYERSFQPQFYGLLAAEGVYEDTGERVMRQIEGVHAHQLYPRHFNEATGQLDGRYAYFEAEDLAAFKESVRTVLRRIEHGLKTGEYPAIAGDHCGLCPAPHECPIPKEFRRESAVTTLEEAMDTIAVAEGLATEANRLKGYVRVYAESNELEAVPLAPDSDQEYAFIVTRSEVVADKGAVKQALAERTGSAESFFKPRISTKFAKRKRKESV